MNNAIAIALRELEPNANWIVRDDVIQWKDTEIPKPSDDVINTKVQEVEQKLLQKQQQEELKRTGIPYTEGGDKISFTNEDAIAMMQVKTAFELGVTNTNIEFSNGTILPITTGEFPAFAVWFAQQRNSFFV